MENVRARLDSACSLDRESREERIAMIRGEILPHAERSESLGEGRAWEFANTPAMKEKLEHLVALESECCREGITFHLVERAAQGLLRLELHGIDPGAQVGAVTDAGGGRRLRGWAKAGGAGLAISFALFCALPLAAVAVFGAAAAPLAGLDDPYVVGAGALVAALLAWRVLERRGRRGATT